VLGAVVPLPDAAADDFGRVDTAERLRTPEAWREWLCEPTGCLALAGGELVSETRYMDRAQPGSAVGGYVKTSLVLRGCQVWEKQDG
jgi:hypothetical protein